MQLIGYRLDKDGEQMLLAVHRKDYYVRYKKEDIPIPLSYAMVKDGTYNDPVRDVPYFVLDGFVYTVKSFEPLNRDKRQGRGAHK